MSKYAISVVVPSMRGWPVMRLSVDALLPQVRSAAGQLIVADGSGGEMPAELKGATDIIWLSLPGAGVFELRQAAYRRADAQIIASTEDHCRPADDWVDAVLRAHAEHPTAAMIFGPVGNGSTRHLIDWALYCVGYGAWAPPLATGERQNPGHANTSWKRWAFSRLQPEPDHVIEFRFNDALRSSGEQVVGDDRLRVEHFQCDGIGPTSRLMFHNGRVIAGLRRNRMGASDWFRAVAPPVIAIKRWAVTMRQTLPRRGLRGVALRSSGLIAVLHFVHALGESVGYFAGPGDSARHLH